MGTCPVEPGAALTEQPRAAELPRARGRGLQRMGDVGGKILLGRSGGETTVPLTLSRICSWLPGSPPKVATGLGEGSAGLAPKHQEGCVFLGELGSPSRSCKFPLKGEKAAMQILRTLLMPFTFGKLVME